MSHLEFRQFFMTTKIIAGHGCIHKIPEELKKMNARKILIVTDMGIKSANILDKILKVMDSSELTYVISEDVKPNPDVQNVDNSYQKIKDTSVDSVLAVGGGSVIDTAKALGTLLTNGGSIGDYFGREMYNNDPLPIFAVPTTVGTGSEVTRACVISKHESFEKKIVGGASMAPRIAFLDPSLLTTLPSQLVAATGMDAMTHAIEGYVSNNSTHISDALNLHAIRLIGSNIRPAVANSKNIEAINTMLMASTTTGIGFGNSLLGMVHSISHAIGGHYDAPHGILNAILLPYVLEFNWIGNPRKFADIAQALGVNITNLTIEEAAKAAVENITVLSREIGIPEKLSEIGIDSSKIDALVEQAFHDVYISTNPRQPSAKDLYKIIQAAM
jgi:alcohol dehydrogenase class IV